VNARGLPTRRLAQGQAGALLLDVVLRRGAAAPARLEHRFVLSLGRGAGGPRRLSTTGAPVRVERQAPVVIGPPLRGENIAVIGCCGLPFAHRLAVMELDGGLFVAQRYAIDFVRVDDQLGTFAGDPARNESYLLFGAEVIAVADGRVAATRDGVPENTPPGVPPNVALNDLAGNFVTQDLGGGRFALYAHLQPGSVRVRPGEQVRRGQVLGLVGNTGNSSEPHLHFHVMDGPGGQSNLAADGVPYVFDRLRLDARVTGFERNPPVLTRQPAPRPLERTRQYPLTGDIVAFP
jgi:hypothetical protein